MIQVLKPVAAAIIENAHIVYTNFQHTTVSVGIPIYLTFSNLNALTP